MVLDELIDYTDSEMQKNQENIEKMRILFGTDYMEKKGIGKDPDTFYTAHFSGPLSLLSVEEIKFFKNASLEISRRINY